MRPTFPTEYLYVRTSGLRAFNEATQDYDKLIGRGLFTAARIPKGHIICEFIGDVISTEENNFNVWMNSDREGYQIQLSKEFVLDCFDYKDICLASMANDYRDVFDTRRNRMAEMNAELVVVNKRVGEIINRYAYLYCIEDILPGAEVITWYSDEFELNPAVDERMVENFRFFQQLQENHPLAMNHPIVIDLTDDE